MAIHITSPIRLKSIEKALRQYDLSEQSTVRVPAIRPLQRALLPIDEHGRHYVESSSHADTFALIAFEIERYMLATGELPTAIELSTLRYVALGSASRLYRVGQSMIPIRYALNANFDIKVIGK